MFSFLKKNSPKTADEKSGSGWIARLKSGLARTGGQITDLFGRGGKIDDDLYEELETILITADVGMDATNALLADLRRQVREQHLAEAAQLREALAHSLLKMLKPLAQPLLALDQVKTRKPFVIMMVGVNGAGKTTSIGKLAKYLQDQGLSVMLAAGDTFRAAAREQLMAWGARNSVTVIAQQGGDAAAVIYDAVQAAQARNIDVVLADTAGRLTTQAHLMEEIKKVKRVIAKALPETPTSPAAPHEVLLVLDANTGQNALSQVKAFDQALGVTGLILTKLDGTAKGGVIAAIAHSYHFRAHPIPVRFIGVGEGMDDLQPFVAEDFVAALLGLEE
ncbi:MAG: signal recognition particle-docking protein FtsY [Gallionellales bacterium RIFCSPLOWO2_12_FULL_57_18]|nr:MAG: signal recognition particle-docking protein FtsY [Gallionellales bacterium RIFCSPLOWO2_12_FULL_57_18]OGS96281.1 MAG: signal recognition particle-docking protein FtsY [Gallionellales bacterium RIFCSPLOWO2_02_FULL_57_47]